MLQVPKRAARNCGGLGERRQVPKRAAWNRACAHAAGGLVYLLSVKAWDDNRGAYPPGG